MLLLLLVLPTGAYETWGWRISFVLGGLAGCAFLRYRTRIPESPLWQDSTVRLLPADAAPEARKRRGPLRVVTLGPADAVFRAGVDPDGALAGGHERGLGPAVASADPARQDPVWVTGVLLIAQVTVMAGFGINGALSQKWGRRTTLTAVWGVVTSFCGERFATGIRATGSGSRTASRSCRPASTSSISKASST